MTAPEGSSQVGFFRSAWRRYWPKGFAISVVNGMVLLLVTIASTDKLARTVTFYEPFVSCLIALLLGGMVSVLIVLISLPNMRSRSRTVLSVLIVFVVCGYQYSNLLQNSYDRRIVNRGERAGALTKIAQGDSPATFGVSGSNLTLAEYREVRKSTWFPDVPESAENISFSNVEVDIFLGDYSFSLSYEVPLEESGDASPSYPDVNLPGEVRAEPDGDKLKVWYSESAS